MRGEVPGFSQASMAYRAAQSFQTGLYSQLLRRLQKEGSKQSFLDYRVLSRQGQYGAISELLSKKLLKVDSRQGVGI